MKRIKTYNQLFELSTDCTKWFKYTGIESIKRFLKNGCDINMIFNDGNTIVHLILNYMIDVENGYDLEPHNIEDAESLKLVLNSGFNKIDTLNIFNETPLYLASLLDSYQLFITETDQPEYFILKILIDAGADWNIKTVNKKYFIDYLYPNEIEWLKENYPEKWKEYKRKKNLEKFNI